MSAAVAAVAATCCTGTNTTATTTSAGACDAVGVPSSWVTREHVRCSQGGLLVVRNKEKAVGGGGEASEGGGGSFENLRPDPLSEVVLSHVLMSLLSSAHRCSKGATAATDS